MSSVARSSIRTMTESGMPAPGESTPNSRVGIPTHYYKLIVRKPTFGPPEANAILLPHDNTKRKRTETQACLTQHTASIKEIEAFTRITLFATLDATKRSASENARAPALWPTHEEGGFYSCY